MKTNLIIILAVLLLSSCSAYHAGTIFPSTIINQKGFKVIKIVTGSSEAVYVFGIGGWNRMGLVNEAKQNIYDQIKLEQNQTLANFTLDFKTKFVLPFFIGKEVIVTAEVIEFQ